ncbi:SDR family NAD(P)-dependent oxidoreductase [Rhodohalobacter sulfatireducens]|uniref:SDR family oxidoreductase n=1 Tax=Rhodohalobacter sulfatireducens TaxID=2911366 RepID=A0ABS9KDX2_9BACT|nr:SDR family oxidoreductase [Rhodohalobacter sulfatireducens]MCG2589059.1 SDR family oxidoreductase [Rhodohalobacter sulfatireducens]MDR9367095.1 SDR family oxidoreductase [Balneolaceae bacterium]
MSYKESSVLITGASQGIGRSIAITFAASTRRPILLLARNEKNLEQTKLLCEEAGANQVELLVCDATDMEEVLNLKIPANFPDPGIIINNAGSYLYKTLADTTDEEFRQEIDVNLFTAVHIIKRFLPDLRKADRALVINICSVGALRGLKDSGAYSASKHALLGYTRSLREELMQTDIGVTAINLGQTHSTSWDQSDMSPERLINPTDVASILVTISELSPRSVVEEILIQPQHGRVPAM